MVQSLTIGLSGRANGFRLPSLGHHCLVRRHCGFGVPPTIQIDKVVETR